MFSTRRYIPLATYVFNVLANVIEKGKSSDCTNGRHNALKLSIVCFASD